MSDEWGQILQHLGVMEDDVLRTTPGFIVLNNLNFSKYSKLNSIYSDLLNPYYYDLFRSSPFYDNLHLFFILRSKILEENFLKNLENNYGIFLGADEFIEEIKLKLTLKNNTKIKQIVDNNKLIYNIFLLQTYKKYLRKYYYFSYKREKNIFPFINIAGNPAQPSPSE